MRGIRRRLRLSAVVWLVCHVLSFSALLPRDCCAAHAHAAVDDALCATHHAGTGGGEQMTGACNAPGAALAAVLMQAAVPGVPFALSLRAPVAVVSGVADERPLGLFAPPDSPPPRS